MSKTPLPIKNKKGKSAFYPPPHLLFSMDMAGTIKVDFRPFVYITDESLRVAFSEALLQSLPTISPCLAMHHISHSTAWEFLDLPSSFNSKSLGEYGLILSSSTYYFPVTLKTGLWDLQKAFIVLYPLFDAILCISKGRRHELPTMMETLRTWLTRLDEEPTSLDEQGEALVDLPQLDSYRFTRAGLWWDILARDRWRCRSCGRTAKKDGVTLHVDHIIPRSLGGKDEAGNLQTLCEKCNIGKSNRDSTDLSKLE